MGTWQRNSTLVGRTPVPRVAERLKRNSHLRSVKHCSALGSLKFGTTQAIAIGLHGSQTSLETGQQSYLIGRLGHFPSSQSQIPIDVSETVS